MLHVNLIATIFRVLICSFCFEAFCGLASAEIINSWQGPTSTNWEAPYWSFGILPASNQSVFITNSGYKAVGISRMTTENYPASMTVSNLTIGAPDNALNTLLLNYAPTGLPLRVIGQCTLKTNGILMTLYSAVDFDSDLTIQGGQYIEEGGTALPANRSFYVQNGSVRLTNATI